jgi:predicted dehydrogenase
MRFAIVGCGYVADFYLATLKNHPELELCGVFDRVPASSRRCAGFWKLRQYGSLDELLSDPRVELVANLTNPHSHHEVSRAALEAGKHVYSEKPLATSFADAQALVELAEKRDLMLASAPCNILGESAQTLWKALRQGKIGVPRLAYAEIDDGPVPLMGYRRWASESGAPWPYKDEFEVGATLEHAGYYLGWLAAFFGPARSITSFAHVVMPDKGVPLDVNTPDLAVGCVTFASGPVARLTCSLYAPHDHRLRVFGDRGVLSVEDCWNYGSPVLLSRRTKLGLRAEKYPRAARLVGLGPKELPMVRKARFRQGGRGSNPMDFCRGIAELALAREERRPPRLSARWSLHVNELVLAMQDPGTYGSPREVRSTFEPLAPEPWAR